MKAKIPVIIVNFKTYAESTGNNAEKLAAACNKLSEKKGVSIVSAVQAVDIFRVSELGADTFAQHIDPAGLGAFTGKVTAEAVKENGASGTLINHSEDRVPMEIIQKNILKARSLGLISCVCAETPEEAEKIAKLDPDFIAIEPPELIGGDISVSTAKPEIISDTVKTVNRINPKVAVLCGAGVKTGKDVSIAYKLGAKGILVASGVTKAKDPERVLDEFCEGLK